MSMLYENGRLYSRPTIRSDREWGVGHGLETQKLGVILAHAQDTIYFCRLPYSCFHASCTFKAVCACAFFPGLFIIILHRGFL